MEKKIKFKKINLKNKKSTDNKNNTYKTNHLNLKIDYKYVLVISVVLVLVLYLVLNLKNEQKYTINYGKIEKSSIVDNVYIIKNESLIERDTSKTLIPVVSDSKRVQKSQIIATYKGSEYENYETELAKIDNEILDAIESLNLNYSTEIESIDSQISQELLNVKSCVSYAKMQSIKQTINNLLTKKIKLIAAQSPKDSEISSLIKKRESYENKAKASNDNIKANMAGIVSYKTDGYEELIKASEIDNITYSDIKQIIDNKNNSNKTSIKVMDNYKAYVIMQVDNEYEEYLNEDQKYILRLISDDNYEYTATLYRMEELDDNNLELVFIITNGIEKLLDIRETEFEVVFDKTSGFIVPNTSLIYNSENATYYVRAIRYREYVDLPVHVKTQDNNFSIITSYTEDELIDMNMTTKYSVKLYENILEKIN